MPTTLLYNVILHPPLLKPASWLRLRLTLAQLAVVACLLFPCLLLHAQCRVPAAGTMPHWFSGTNCQISGFAKTAGGAIVHAQLLINGTVVKEWFNTLAPVQSRSVPTSVTLSCVFDSTHFPDANTITVTAKAWDIIGNLTQPESWVENEMDKSRNTFKFAVSRPQ